MELVFFCMGSMGFLKSVEAFLGKQNWPSCVFCIPHRLMWICPEASTKGTNFSRNRTLNIEHVGDTCNVWCCIICHQHTAAWKLKKVETFDYKVNFLLLCLCPAHLVSASSSSNSRDGRPVCQAGLAQALPSTLPFGIIYSLLYFPALFRLVREKKTC